MDEILHHLRHPGMMVPLKIPANNGFNHGLQVVRNGFRPSTVVAPVFLAFRQVLVHAVQDALLILPGLQRHPSRDPLPRRRMRPDPSPKKNGLERVFWAKQRSRASGSASGGEAWLGLDALGLGLAYRADVGLI